MFEGIIQECDQETFFYSKGGYVRGCINAPVGGKPRYVTIPCSDTLETLLEEGKPYKLVVIGPSVLTTWKE